MKRTFHLCGAGVAGVAVVAALAALPACRRLSAASGPAPGPGEAVAALGGVEDVFLLSGEIAAVQSDALTVPRIETDEVQITWLAEDGSQVKEGDRVVEFEAASVQATLEERRSRLRQAQIERENRQRSLDAEREQKAAEVDKAGVEVDKARIDAAVPQQMRSSLEWRKLQAALKDREAALEKARLALAAFDVSAKAELRGLLAAEEKARRAAQAAENAIESVSLRARRSGIVLVAQYWRDDGERKLQAGDNVFQGLTVATIPDITRMEVAARLSQVDHGRIAAGMKARVVIDSFPDRVFEGRVEEVGAVAAEGRFRIGGFPVRVSLERSDPELMRPGLSVRVEVIRGQWARSLVVPRRAVRFAGDKASVVRPGAGAGAVDVRIAGCSPLACAVESGLAEGERVRLF